MAQKSHGTSGTGTNVVVKGGMVEGQPTDTRTTVRTDSANKAKRGAGNVGNANVNRGNQ